MAREKIEINGDIIREAIEDLIENQELQAKLKQILEEALKSSAKFNNPKLENLVFNRMRNEFMTRLKSEEQEIAEEDYLADDKSIALEQILPNIMFPFWSCRPCLKTETENEKNGHVIKEKEILLKQKTLRESPHFNQARSNILALKDSQKSSKPKVYFMYAAPLPTFQEREYWIEEFLANLYADLNTVGIEAIFNLESNFAGNNIASFMGQILHDNCIVIVFGTESFRCAWYGQKTALQTEGKLLHLKWLIDFHHNKFGPNQKTRIIPMVLTGIHETALPEELLPAEGITALQLTELPYKQILIHILSTAFRVKQQRITDCFTGNAELKAKPVPPISLPVQKNMEEARKLLEYKNDVLVNNTYALFHLVKAYYLCQHHQENKHLLDEITSKISDVVKFIELELQKGVWEKNLLHHLAEYKDRDDANDISALKYICQTWPKFLQADMLNAEMNTTIKRTPLHIALEQSHDAAAKFFIEQGANIATGYFGNTARTALHIACEKGLPEIVDKLLAHPQAQQTYRTNDQDTPFVDLTTGKELGKKTALHLAAENGHLTIITKLLKKNANIYCQNANGVPVLDVLISIVNFENKAQQDEMCCSLLETYKGQNKIKLLDQRKKVQLVYEAVQQGLLNTIKTLFSLEIIIPETSEQSKFLCAAANGLHTSRNELNEKRYLQIIYFLLENGADAKAKLAPRYTVNLFHFACEKGCFELVQYLLNRNKSLIFIKDENDKTPLHSACEGQQDYPELVKLLLKHDSSAIGQIDQYKRHSLHYAAARGKKQTVKLLLRHGAKNFINIKDDRDNTSLHLVCDEMRLTALQEEERAEIVCCLLANGADREIINKDNQTPLSLVEMYGHEKLRNIFYDPYANRIRAYVKFNSDRTEQTRLSLAQYVNQSNPIYDQAKLLGENLEGSNFVNTSFKGADFRGSRMKHVSFFKANVAHAKITYCKGLQAKKLAQAEDIDDLYASSDEEDNSAIIRTTQEIKNSYTQAKQYAANSVNHFDRFMMLFNLIEIKKMTAEISSDLQP